MSGAGPLRRAVSRGRRSVAVHGAGPAVAASILATWNTLEPMVQKQDLTRLLNGLLEDIEDGRIGFGQAAQEIESPEMRAPLLDCAYDCAKALNALQQCVSSLGGSAVRQGSTGTVVRSAAVSDSVLAFLEELELRHARIEAAFAVVLAAELPESIRAAVQQEKLLVEHNLVRINEARRRHQGGDDAA